MSLVEFSDFQLEDEIDKILFNILKNAFSDENFCENIFDQFYEDCTKLHDQILLENPPPQTLDKNWSKLADEHADKYHEAVQEQWPKIRKRFAMKLVEALKDGTY